jgi:hypothetical protein
VGSKNFCFSLTEDAINEPADAKLAKGAEMVGNLYSTYNEDGAGGIMKSGLEDAMKNKETMESGKAFIENAGQGCTGLKKKCIIF